MTTNWGFRFGPLVQTIQWLTCHCQAFGEQEIEKDATMISWKKEKRNMVFSIFSCSSLILVNQWKARDEVSVASVPLRGTKGPAQLLVSAAYNLHSWDLQHFMVIVKPATTLNSQSQVQLLPFLFPDRSEKVLQWHICWHWNQNDETGTFFFLLGFYMQVCAFDFQPEDPENISTALAALSARSIPGSEKISFER